MSLKLIQAIKKAVRTTAIFIKRIPNLNFKTKEEIIEAYNLDGDFAYYESRRRHKRFNYYLNVFELAEPFFLDELTEKQKEQFGLIWKLVDLEGGCHE